MSHPSSPTDHFRLNMTLGYGANLPAIPVPVPPATCWWDVSNWQSFLLDLGSLTGTAYPTNMFDAPTQMATKTFQSSTQFGAALPMTGRVDQATYNKAVAAGMTPYPTS